MTQPKTKCTFDVLLRFVAGFLMTCQNSYIWCIITRKSRFSHDVPKRCKFVALLRGKAGFLMTQPKAKCTFDALLRFLADFLMTHQKLLYLIHYYEEKQGFSWRTKNMQIYCIITWKSRFHDATENKVHIWCIIMFRSRFSHDVPTTLIFSALLRGKAGFPMTRQKLLY